MKLFALLLLFFSTYSYAETLYYPNNAQSLFSLTKTLRQTERGIELVLTIKNTTDEINGNGLEKIVEGIEIQYPLPPSEWFVLSDSNASRGEVEIKDQELAMCQPAMLGRLKGFEQGNEGLHDELAAHFESDILPRMKPSLSYWLVGHTDTKGRASYNKKLSLSRAEAVKQVLANAGFETGHITAFGEGENSPLTLEQDEASHELNRRVEIYPKQHSWVYWQLSNFKPDEEAELAFILKPNTWASSEELEAVLFNDSCYQLSMLHQYTIPTHAQLHLHSHIKPAGKNWTQTADVSSCDGVTVELAINNNGARSARNMHIANQLPLEWQLSGIEDFKQRKDSKTHVLDWTRKRLYPNKSVKLQYQIRPPFLSIQPDKSQADNQFCSEDRYDNPFFGVGCLVAKQLQDNIKPEIVTQQHYVALTAKGYPSVKAQNTIRWHTPSLVLQALSPQIQYSGERIEQTLIVTNNGNVPIKQLKIVANLPQRIHSLEAPHARQKTDEQITWILGKLPPQAQQQVKLSFFPNGNQSDLMMTQFIVYDQVYGAKQCVRSETQVQTLIKPLIEPQLSLRAEYETVAVGKKLFYQVELKNPNPIELAYTIAGQLDPRIWNQIYQPVTGILHGKHKQSNILLQVRMLPSGELRIMHSNRQLVTLPAQGRLLFNFTLQPKAISENVLQAIAANLASQFSVAHIKMQAKSHHELTEDKQQTQTVIYQ
ncbi:OmpA family protein [Candidatus Albibeggiatoa sp. nov. NOAA]|uniref:OmpA family protein n=1 Tax=Candidatus Albibeggiatoa sp. nov. NOAA TaxID=3162724 RepID=UPI0033022E86|nr:OmpA family protein [Thiotrichaceae bacterium]